MRRLLVFSCVLAFVLFAATATGCQKPKTPTDLVLDAASEQIEQYNEGYDAAFVALRELNSPDQSQEHWKRTADLFAEAEAWMPKRRAALEAADAQWRKVGEMNASEGSQRYATLMREVVSIKQREETTTAGILSVCRELSEYYAARPAGQAVANEKWRTLGELDAAAVQVSAEVQARQREAVKYSGGRPTFRTWDD